MNKQHIAGSGSARQLIASGMPSESLAGFFFFFFFKPPVLHMCKKKTQKHKAIQSNRTPQKGQVQALQLSNPIKNVISMSSKEDAVPF